MQFPDGVTEQQFIGQYWQRQPLLFPKAFTEIAGLISTDELFSLACRDEVESRLVKYNAATDEYQLEYGPFERAQLNALNDETPWTLLVQSVNLWHEGVAKLIDTIRFIPQWRYDDIMISVASPGGGVGPHTDQYDVFLLQIDGTRQWRVGEQGQAIDEAESNSELQLIAPFSAKIAEQLAIGDMIYVPPATPHEGTSITHGMTLSIGFRSPSSSELGMMLAEEITQKDSYYRDPSELAVQHPYEITPKAMHQLKDWFTQSFDDKSLYLAFGKLQTQPKQELLLTDFECSISNWLEQGHVAMRDPAARIAWWQEQQIIHLFCNGEHQEFCADAMTFINAITEMQDIDLHNISSYIGQNEFHDILNFLADVGFYGTLNPDE